MVSIKIKGRTISRGCAEGEVLISTDPISFLGSVDPKTGIVVEEKHALAGKSIKGKVLIFPHGKGSTVGSYVMYQLKKNGAAPTAIINLETEPIVAVGAIISLVITFFLTMPIANAWPGFGGLVTVLLNIAAAMLGANIALKKKEEILNFFSGLRVKGHTPKEKAEKQVLTGTPKVLDTSVIIDGRIYDICKTGFVEGKLIIPFYVLEELRHIADSSDSLKRNRGRRGLDIQNKIQNELDIEVEIWEKDYKDIQEVDSKLLKLATEIKGQVVTNDYNLNKVAEFQRVPVLNINELANAVKPMLLPGEEMSLLISKVGKEQNQGIGYLDDGTMIVVEDGKKYVGETLFVIVTSVLQTAAGRMIFAKPKVD